MEYSKQILGLFDEPKYMGILPFSDNIYQAEIFGSSSSNFVKLYLQIDNLGIIRRAGYLVNGCPVLIACCEMMVKLVLGTSVNDAKVIDYLEIASLLKIADLKLHCAIQVEEALYVALTKYLEKS